MRYTIGQLAEIIDGDRGKNYPKQDEFYPQGYCLFLNTGNVTKEGLIFEENQFIMKEKDEALRNGKLKGGDIVYTTRGTVGNAGYYNSSVPYENVRINSGMVILRSNGEIVDARFLYQILKSEYYRPYFKQYCTGSAQPQLPIKNFSQIYLNVPDIKTQHRIADILSVYDNLIENNQKQIKLLEEAAQRLYKEWFVDLRFPGHENTKIVDGVPEGWNECTVESFGTVITGKTPPTSNKEYYTNGKVPFVTIPDMHNVVYPLKTEKRLTIEGAQTQKNKYIPPNSVMISCIGTVGLVSIATEVCQTNQQINSIILNNEDDLYFFYESMLRMKDLLDGLGSNGATMTNVNKSKLEKLIIISPSKDIVKQYNDVCKPLFESALNSSRKNVYLKNMREALLPKLMSGEVEV